MSEDYLGLRLSNLETKNASGRNPILLKASWPWSRGAFLGPLDLSRDSIYLNTKAFFP